MTGQSDTQPIEKPARAKKSNWRFVWWALLWLILALVLCAALVWNKRYSLAEWQVRKEFAKAGIAAQLDIDHINKEQAVINGITLSSGGEEFFVASGMTLEYDFQKLRDGELERIVVRDPVLHIKLNEQGRIINDWMPAPSEEPLKFPSNGIAIEDAKLSWAAPFGHGTALVNTDIRSAIDWILIVDSRDTVLTYQDVLVELAYQGSVKQSSEHVFSAAGSLSTRGLDTNVLKTGAAKTDFNFEFSRGDTAQFYDVKGWLKMAGADIQAESYGVKRAALRLDLQTRFDMQARRFTQFMADWDVDSNDIVIKNAQMDAPKPLISLPIVGNFVPFFPAKFNSLLQKFSMQGRGRFSVSPGGYSLILSEALRLKNSAQSLIVNGSGDNEFLVYDALAGAIMLQADMEWTGEQALTVSNFSARGKSLGGMDLSALTYLQARVQSRAAWQTHIKGQAQRLAPFDLQFSYNDRKNSKAINLDGVLGYDGFVPGGQVTGFLAGGALNIDMAQSGFTVGFAPSAPIRMDIFETEAGWRGDSISLMVEGTEDLYTQTLSGGRMQAKLKAVSAQIASPEDDRHVEAFFDAVDISALLTKGAQTLDVTLKGARIQSDDLPSPGTKITSEISTVHLELGANGDVRFVSKNPKAAIETQNVRVANIAIDLGGSPTDFTAQYKAESVEMIGADYPVLPMRGAARFQDGVLTGNALTDLPKTKDTPIEIEFRSVDGQGEAHISIPKITFDPFGLQPQHLVPSLAGKLADVNGEVSAQFDFAFGGGQPVRSKGTTDVIDLDLGTLVGPLSGVNTQLVFSSIFPLKTKGVQVATVSGFNPGFLFENGKIRFEIVPSGVRIDEAVWPIKNVNAAAGQIYIAPMLWKFGNVKNRAVVHVQDVELGTLLAKIGKDKFSATGRVSGTLPAVVEGVSTRIDNGVLAINNGGVIRFKSAGTDAAAERSENASYAFQALENFTYQKMEVRIDGPIGGDIDLDMIFDGKNPDVLGGQGFLFNVGVHGELVNIVQNLNKSFSSQETLNRIIALQAKE